MIRVFTVRIQLEEGGVWIDALRIQDGPQLACDLIVTAAGEHITGEIWDIQELSYGERINFFEGIA